MGGPADEQRERGQCKEDSRADEGMEFHPVCLEHPGSREAVMEPGSQPLHEHEAQQQHVGPQQNESLVQTDSGRSSGTTNR